MNENEEMTEAWKLHTDECRNKKVLETGQGC